jgi:hypothetical protein
MSFITVEAQPAGAVKHGKWCQGGKPGWKSCERCTKREVAACIAFWEAMGGVPEVVRMHTEARLASHKPSRIKVRPIAFVETA